MLFWANTWNANQAAANNTIRMPIRRNHLVALIVYSLISGWNWFAAERAWAPNICAARSASARAAMRTCSTTACVSTLGLPSPGSSGTQRWLPDEWPLFTSASMVSTKFSIGRMR